MKTFEICEGIKETTKNVIVDIDVYLGRERYYTGTLACRVIRFSKGVYPDLFKKWNDHYECEIDMLIARYNDGEELKGVSIQNKGYKVQ